MSTLEHLAFLKSFSIGLTLLSICSLSFGKDFQIVTQEVTTTLSINGSDVRTAVGTGECETVRRDIVIEGNRIGLVIERPLKNNCLIGNLVLVLDEIALSGPSGVSEDDFETVPGKGFRWIESYGTVYFDIDATQAKALAKKSNITETGLITPDCARNCLTDRTVAKIDVDSRLKRTEAASALNNNLSVRDLLSVYKRTKSIEVFDLINKKCQTTAPECQFGHIFDPNTERVWRVCDVGTSYDLKSGKCEGQPLKRNWINAVKYTNDLNKRAFEGYSDWRLPTSSDLKQLLQTNTEISSSNLGGKFLPTEVCKAANGVIYTNFGSARVLGDFFSSHRWMADNHDKTSLQNPLAMNLVDSYGMHRVGYCNVLAQAFFPLNRTGEIRPHAELPFMLVRDHRPDEIWTQALSAIPREKQIESESFARAKASIGRINSQLGWVAKKFEEFKESAARAPASSQEGVSSPDQVSASASSSGKWTFVKTYTGGFAKFGLDRPRPVHVVKCANGGEHEVYQENNGKWGTGGSLLSNHSASSFEQGASEACK